MHTSSFGLVCININMAAGVPFWQGAPLRRSCRQAFSVLMRSVKTGLEPYRPLVRDRLYERQNQTKKRYNYMKIAASCVNKQNNKMRFMLIGFAQQKGNLIQSQYKSHCRVEACRPRSTTFELCWTPMRIRNTSHPYRRDKIYLVRQYAPIFTHFPRRIRRMLPLRIGFFPTIEFPRRTGYILSLR